MVEGHHGQTPPVVQRQMDPTDESGRKRSRYFLFAVLTIGMIAVIIELSIILKLSILNYFETTSWNFPQHLKKAAI